MILSNYYTNFNRNTGILAICKNIHHSDQKHQTKYVISIRKYVVKGCLLFSAILPLDLIHHSRSQKNMFTFFNKILLDRHIWYFKLFLTYLTRCQRLTQGLETLQRSVSVSQKHGLETANKQKHLSHSSTVCTSINFLHGHPAAVLNQWKRMKTGPRNPGKGGCNLSQAFSSRF